VGIKEGMQERWTQWQLIGQLVEQSLRRPSLKALFSCDDLGRRDASTAGSLVGGRSFRKCSIKGYSEKSFERGNLLHEK
jgi:hypothetical protein